MAKLEILKAPYDSDVENVVSGTLNDVVSCEIRGSAVRHLLRVKLRPSKTFIFRTKSGSDIFPDPSMSIPVFKYVLRTHFVGHRLRVSDFFFFDIVSGLL